MPHKLLLVEPSSASIDTGLSCAGQLVLDCVLERRTWEIFQPKVLDTPADVILISAVPDPEPLLCFFDWLRTHPMETPTVAILPERPDSPIFQTAFEMADDFILFPVRGGEISQRLMRILGPTTVNPEPPFRRLVAELGHSRMIGTHRSFLHALQQTASFATSCAPVLIEGETGTGKELFAHAIHSLSNRRLGPFVPVECGALPEQLAENELFGHSRGAFTDAYSDQKGLAGLAEGGTLFLDEVDTLSLSNQAKLLRFLQEGTYRALGSDQFKRGDVRVISATSQSLEECVQRREFRQDLYFRLHVLRLKLPPLRERCGDISLLGRHFLDALAAETKSERKLLSPAGLQKLEAYCWPGNVRELLNAIQRAFYLSPGKQILPCHIVLSSSKEFEVSEVENFRVAKRRVLEKFEASYVEALLRRHNGNITRAAQDAGKERRTFGRLVKKYSLSQDRPAAGQRCPRA